MPASAIDVDAVVAIDVHVHAHEYDPPSDMTRAAARYFGSEDVPADLDALAAYYRERRLAAVVFSVDERLSGRAVVPNDAVLAAAVRHPDVLIPFASVDPMRGADAVKEARRRIG